MHSVYVRVLTVLCGGCGGMLLKFSAEMIFADVDIPADLIDTDVLRDMLIDVLHGFLDDLTACRKTAKFLLAISGGMLYTDKVSAGVMEW